MGKSIIFVKNVNIRQALTWEKRNTSQEHILEFHLIVLNVKIWMTLNETKELLNIRQNLIMSIILEM